MKTWRIVLTVAIVLVLAAGSAEAMGNLYGKEIKPANNGVQTTAAISVGYEDLWSSLQRRVRRRIEKEDWPWLAIAPGILAANELMKKYINPEKLTKLIVSIEYDTVKRVTRVRYKVGSATLTVYVSWGSNTAYFAGGIGPYPNPYPYPHDYSKAIAESVYERRKEIAQSMYGAGWEGYLQFVHVNAIHPVATYPPPPKWYYFTARVGSEPHSYTLILEYKAWDYYLMKPVTYLHSFTNEATRTDYVGKARLEVYKLFNILSPRVPPLLVPSWTREGGSLKLDFVYFVPLGPPSPYIANAPIPVKVGIWPTKEDVTIEKNIVDAVTKARTEASRRVDVGYGNTWVMDIRILNGGYRLEIGTPLRTITYDYYNNNRLLLSSWSASSILAGGGHDIWTLATKYLRDRLQSDQFVLLGDWGRVTQSWTDSLDYLQFKLPDGRIVTVLYDPLTGEMRISWDDSFEDLNKPDDRRHKKDEDKEGAVVNEELLQRKAVEETVQTQAADPVFVGQMASETNNNIMPILSEIHDAAK